MNYTLQERNEYLYTVKKSKFHAYIYPLSQETDIDVFVKVQKNEHPKSKHVCYGARYFVGKELREKASDQGEPSGTAGLPILKALKSEKLINCLVIVVRYFGGTKLGIPGLIDAYFTSSKNVIKKLKKVEYKEYKIYETTIHISEFNKTKKNIEDQKGNIIKSDFLGNTVSIRYEIPLKPTTKKL